MRWLLILLVVQSVSLVLFADVVHLKDGGKVEGTVLESTWRVQVRLPNGSVVEFKPDDVVKIDYSELPPEKEYEKRLEGVPKDDAEAYYRLGLWCREKGLKKQSEECLKKAIELEPDHTGARTALGYVRHKGEWVLYEEMMKDKGLVLYKGRWMTPAERDAVIFEERQQKWRMDVRRLENDIMDANSVEAEKKYKEIKDEAALKWLLERLGSSSEKMRLLTVETLCNFDVSRVGDALIESALKDRSDEVRKAAASALRRLRCRWAYVKFLEAMFYSKEGGIRGNAVDALGTLKDKNAISPLAHALIIKISSGVSEAGGQEFFIGSVARRVIGYKEILDKYGNRVKVPIIATVTEGTGPSSYGREGESYEMNFPAREALRQITGKDFNYDKEEWLKWLKENEDKFDDFMNPVEDEKKKEEGKK
ncbi:MAG: HEAT repeat domain-containing protein [Planctomycetota bacterium]|nr:HEAT repeat domain-containing protein [Planctomycetota bacterium]